MDQAARLRELAAQRGATPGTSPPSLARAVVVSSGKGGVGKTNLAVNLAIALARSGQRVGLLDADLGLANIDIVLGVTPTYNLSHVIAGHKSLGEIALRGPEGVILYAGGSGVQELANLSPWRVDHFIRSLGELDAHLDLLLIDTGAGLSHTVTAFLLAVPEVILVTTPEPTAVADAYGVVKVLAGRNPEVRVQLVVNMAQDQAQAEEVWRALTAVSRQYLSQAPTLDLLGWVPFDPAVRRAVLQQVPFLLAAPASRAAREVYAIAARLRGTPPRGATGIRRLFARVAGLLR